MNLSDVIYTVRVVFDSTSYIHWYIIQYICVTHSEHCCHLDNILRRAHIGRIFHCVAFKINKGEHTLIIIRLIVGKGKKH